MRQGDIYMMKHDFHNQPHPYMVISNDRICQNGGSEILMVYMTSQNRYKKGYPTDVLVKDTDVYQDGQTPFKTGTAMTESVRNFKKSAVGTYKGHVKEEKLKHIMQVFYSTV